MATADVDAGLATRLLRFREAATEAEYRLWRQTAVLPHLRLGYVGSLIAWAVVGLPGLHIFIPELVERHPVAFAFDWLVVTPVLLVGFVITFLPRFRAIATPVTAFANLLAGATVVWQAHRLLGDPGVAAGFAVTVVFFATAVFRLPTLLAAVVVGPYLILAGALNLSMLNSGEMSDWSFRGYEIMLSNCFVLGMLVSVVLDQTMRSRFRSERIIERQTRALEEERAQISRFLSEEVTAMIRDKGIDETLKQQTLDLTALVCDLRGFTRYTETHGAEKMGAVLRDYYAKIVEVAKRHGGTVKDFAGDGGLILVGAPVARTDHATAGAALARDLVAEVREIIRPYSSDETPLGIGAGVASGLCAVGAIGSQSRLEYTAVGTPVNLAARLCAQAGDGEVLYSPDTAALLSSTEGFRRQPLEVKGFAEPVEVLIEAVR